MTIQGTNWSTTDIATGANTQPAVFSNSNLTVKLAGGSGSNQASGRTVQILKAGKYYWEITADLIGGFTPAPGIVRQAANLGTFGATGGNWPGGCVWLDSGGVYRNGVANVTTWAAWVQGNILGFAVDLGARLFWGRVGSGGNWNNSGTANPATGAGGLDVSALSGDLAPVYWFNDFSGAASQVTANFGSTAFNGVVPSGFVAGVPSANALDGMMFNTLF